MFSAGSYFKDFHVYPSQNSAQSILRMLMFVAVVDRPSVVIISINTLNIFSLCYRRNLLQSFFVVGRDQITPAWYYLFNSYLHHQLVYVFSQICCLVPMVHFISSIPSFILSQLWISNFLLNSRRIGRWARRLRWNIIDQHVFCISYKSDEAAISHSVHGSYMCCYCAPASDSSWNFARLYPNFLA